MLEGRLDLVAGSDPDSLQHIELESGTVFHIPPRLLHRMVARTECKVLEVSTPHLDDVVRLDDRYGREGTSAP